MEGLPILSRAVARSVVAPARLVLSVVASGNAAEGSAISPSALAAAALTSGRWSPSRAMSGPTAAFTLATSTSGPRAAAAFTRTDQLASL